MSDSQWSKVKVVFFGTSHFAKEILAYLIENQTNVVKIVTQPDRPAGRRQLTKPTEVKKFAQKFHLPLFQPEHLDDKVITIFKKNDFDLAIVADYGLILPAALLKIAPQGFVNIHPSLLPQLRGSSPIQTALLNGLTETGISLMLMDEEVDHGSLLAQIKVTIKPNDDYLLLEEKLIDATKKILLPTLQKWIAKEISPQPQNHVQATFTKIIDKQDGEIIWMNSAQEIYNQYRALNIWPKVYSFWKRDQDQPKKIILHQLSPEKDTPETEKETPGKVIKVNNEKIAIKAGKGIVLLKELQLEGKKPMTVHDFLNGYPDFLGTVLG